MCTVIKINAIFKCIRIRIDFVCHVFSLVYKSGARHWYAQTFPSLQAFLLLMQLIYLVHPAYTHAVCHSGVTFPLTKNILLIVLLGVYTC